MNNLVATVAIYSSGTSINEALELSTQAITDFLKSKAFADWKKSREAEVKIQHGIADRLNSIIKGLGNLGKLRR